MTLLLLPSKEVFIMPVYHEFDLTKMKIVLTSGELLSLLQRDRDIFKRGLVRGKYAIRAESKSAQYESKLAQHESQLLNDLIQ
jgi:hypothetical protein